MVCHTDVATHSLLKLPWPYRTEYHPLEAIIPKVTEVRIGKKPASPLDPVVLNMTADFPGFTPADPAHRWKMDVTLEPRANYLVSRHEMSVHASGQNVKRVVTVEKFKEAVPGVFVPEETVFQLWIDGQLRAGERRLRLTDIVCNRPISPEVFRLRPPRGTIYTDEIRNVQYTIDENGQPLSPAKAAPKVSIAAAPPSTAAPGSRVTWWLRLPTDPGQWFLAIALLLIGLAVFTKIRSRWWN